MCLRDTNIKGHYPLLTPHFLHTELPATDAATRVVQNARQTIRAVLSGADDRLLVIVGPCSIHDPEAACDYARRLAALREEVSDELYVVMRVYFEKPRTTTGWKGLINDPDLDDSTNINRGIRLARELLIEINGMGLPAATEFLDPFTPTYIDDLVSWAAIGARTTESQTHRQMASGLSMPVGYKNGTQGDIEPAVSAMKAARAPHHFVGINDRGLACTVRTRGNPDGHLILRGGKTCRNYAPEFLKEARGALSAAGLPTNVMVDCSHANSEKCYQKQQGVWRSVISQRAENLSIIGAMIESNLRPGRQEVNGGQYGVSITDACVGWSKTEQMLREAAGYFRACRAENARLV